MKLKIHSTQNFKFTNNKINIIVMLLTEQYYSLVNIKYHCNTIKIYQR